MIDARWSFKQNFDVLRLKEYEYHALGSLMQFDDDPRGKNKRHLSIVFNYIGLYAAPTWTYAQKQEFTDALRMKSMQGDSGCNI